MAYFNRGLIAYLFPVRYYAADGNFKTNGKLAVSITLTARLETVKLVAKNIIILVANVQFKIGPLVFIK